MNYKYKPEEWKDRIIEAINNTDSMIQAANYLGLERKTFNKMAKELGLYKPNQGLKGITKNRNVNTILLEDILSNKKPYQSHKLKIKLIEANLKENKCEICGINSWLGKELSLQLHHINGNHNDNSLDNLQILCPNCHSLTDTYTAKNKKVNSYNTIKKPKSKTGFIGVIYGKHKDKFLCRTVIKNPNTNKRIQLGYTYDTDNKDELIRLAKLYDDKAIEFYGNEATTNKSLGLY